MNKGVVFFIVVVLVVLAVIFIPKNKDNVPATDATTDMSQDLQGSVIESMEAEAGVSSEAALPATDASVEGVVEVPATETTPAVTE
jgi:hypothetical protein